MTLALWTNFAQVRRFSLKQEGFSLKLEIFAQAKSQKKKIDNSNLIVLII